MFFRKLFGRPPHKDSAALLYGHMVRQSRLPVFYTDFGVADTVEGRFDLLAAHVALLMGRLKRVEAEHADAAQDLTQALVDLMFADMDVNLRETGASDLSVGRKVRKLAEAFYGRLLAYETALSGDDAQASLNELAAALSRNLYRSVERHASAEAMARYAFDLSKTLKDIPTPQIMLGQIMLGQIMLGGARLGAP